MKVGTNSLPRDHDGNIVDQAYLQDHASISIFLRSQIVTCLRQLANGVLMLALPRSFSTKSADEQTNDGPHHTSEAGFGGCMHVLISQFFHGYTRDVTYDIVDWTQSTPDTARCAAMRTTSVRTSRTELLSSFQPDSPRGCLRTPCRRS